MGLSSGHPGLQENHSIQWKMSAEAVGDHSVKLVGSYWWAEVFLHINHDKRGYESRALFWHCRVKPRTVDKSCGDFWGVKELNSTQNNSYVIH